MASVAVSGSTVTITPGGLTPSQTTETYSVTIAAGTITDVNGLAWAGLVGGGAYSFTLADSVAPTVTTLNPVAGATDLAPGSLTHLSLAPKQKGYAQGSPRLVHNNKTTTKKI